MVEFARDVLGEPLDPWEAWVVVHAGELLPDGRPRFRRLLILVARQNGKTFLLRTLALFWLFVERWPLVLGMSTNLDYARESWEAAVQAAEATPELAALMPRNAVRRANGEQCLTSSDRCRYKIAASNRKGGRSLSIDRLIADELREQHDWTAYNAAYPAMNARPFGQAFFISNQGDDTSVVLDSLHSSALRFVDTGEGDARLGLFEYSAPDDCEPDDPEALAMANPNVGRRIDWDTLLGPARAAKLAGGEELAGFRTEVLCQRVRVLNAAIDSAKWKLCLDPGSLDSLRSRLAVVIDASPDGQHVTLYAAATLADGRVRVDPVAAWEGPGCAEAAERALPGVLARVRPRVLGWLPGGPGAVLAARLKDRKDRRGWPPPGVRVEELRAELPAVCMGFAELVTAGQVAHSGDPLLDAHVAVAQRLRKPGDVWVFSRKGDGQVDAVYAAAGAVHLAKTMPAPVGGPRVVVASRR